MKTTSTVCMLVLLLLSVFSPQLLFSQATVFSDNFESGKPSTQWQRYRAGEDTVIAVTMATAPKPLTGGGSYVGFLQDVDASYTGAAIALAGSASLQDYSIEADVYCYVNTALSAYTGLCVYSDSARGTYIKMAADFDVSKRIRLSNNKLDTLTFLPTFDYTFNAAAIPGGIPTVDGWHKMKIEVRSISATKTGFWCYFDGNILAGCPVIDSSVNVMNAGKFGLYSFQQDADGIAAYFDNIVVGALPTTSVDLPPGASSLPAEFHLQQNYPNPFNPETRIAYNVTTSDFVSLVVFDQLGRSIKTLVSEKRPVGVSTVTWNGRDNLGNAVPSGVYFYSLRTGSIAETRKMILLK
jgi:hypothetical protein